MYFKLNTINYLVSLIISVMFYKVYIINNSNLLTIAASIFSIKYVYTIYSDFYIIYHINNCRECCDILNAWNYKINTAVV